MQRAFQGGSPRAEVLQSTRRLLNCGHSCCAPCLRLMCEKLREVTCPDCRATFKPRPGTSVEAFVKSLTTNFWIFQNSSEEELAYARRSQIYKQSEEVNKARKEYTEVLVSEGSNKGEAVASALGTVLKTVFFTVPFFCMVATYLAFVVVATNR